MALARARRVGVVAGVSIKGAHCPTGWLEGQPECGETHPESIVPVDISTCGCPAAPRRGGIPAAATWRYTAERYFSGGRPGRTGATRLPRNCACCGVQARSARTIHLSESSGADTRITLRIANPASANSLSSSFRDTRDNGGRPIPSLPNVCVST